MICFRVPSVPVAQPRPRACLAVGGKGARMHEVTSIKNAATGERKAHPILAFKATVRLAAEQAYHGAPLEGPLRIDVILVFPRPGNMRWKTRPMPRAPHTKKPDRDNCDKAVLDSLKGTVFVDDSQVVDGRIQKWIAAGDEQPHVEIRISEIDGTDGLFKE